MPIVDSLPSEGGAGLVDSLPGTDLKNKPGPRTAFQREAGRRLANNIQAQGIADQQQSDANAYGDFAKQAVMAGTGLALAPFTGGASVPAAIALATAGGVGASVLGNTAEAALGSDRIKSGRALTGDVILDGILFGGGEGLGRGVGAVVKKALPKVFMQAAKGTEDGAKLLRGEFVKTEEALQNHILTKTRGTMPQVEIGPIVEDAQQAFQKAYQGKGAVGRRYASMNDKTHELFDSFVQDLQVNSAGRLGETQRLDALITAKANFNQALNLEARAGTIPARSEKILQTVANRIDGRIRVHLANVSDEAVNLYNYQKDLFKYQVKKDILIETSTNFLKGLLSKGGGKVLGGAIAGGIGAAVSPGGKGPIQGAAEGAAAGAILSAGPKFSTFVLRHAFENPRAAMMLKQVVNYSIEGSHDKAAALAARAFAVAGTRELVKDYVKNPQSFHHVQEAHVQPVASQ